MNYRKTVREVEAWNSRDGKCGQVYEMVGYENRRTSNDN